MKVRILIVLLLAGQFCRANMSSPIWEGTMTSSAFTSKDIDILSETIIIRIDKDFKTAKYVVEYTIQSDIEGRQIPLLFFAQDYKDSFFVWLDNKRISIQKIPEKYTQFENSPFSQFSSLKNNHSSQNEIDEVAIYWWKNFGSVYRLNDLKYFETDIAKGVHKVRIEYTANVWTDISDWIKEYSFRYSLTPAKFWKSFGTLNVIVEQEGVVRKLCTNIIQPNEKIFNAKSSWTFDKLPSEFLEFSYKPNTNILARLLIIIHPVGIAFIASLILMRLHLHFSFRYRRLNINKRFSPIVIIGSLIVPFLILLSYIFSFGLIDYMIGDDAGGHHGYFFFAIFFYPIIFSIYLGLMWFLDRRQKRNMSKI